MAGEIGPVLRFFDSLKKHPLRAYRRIRWKRKAGWTARLRQDQGIPDVRVMALGNHDLKLALWEVQGPRGNYFKVLPAESRYFVESLFPADDFADQRGFQPTFDQLPFGRYWAVLFVWYGDGRKPCCKVPFRVLDATSKFWRWYEKRFIWIWERYFGGHPTGPPPTQ
jgi:hypothetical protein